MKNSEFDYDPEKDSVPPKILFWIIVSAMVLAVYLSQILV
jgi:hypothetical protein